MNSVFEDLVGQEHIIEILQGAVAASRAGEKTHEMTHAWVFTGPPGSGRSSAAVAFAQALVCSNNGCGQCPDCKSTKTSGHPDVEIIRTEGLSIKVEEVRELLIRVSWAPSLSGWRVVVIEDADRLTESAANALLKAIEEPGTRTVWLLCAPTLHDLVPTIRSRCRHLQLRTPSLETVTNLLINRENTPPRLAEFAARASQGHIGHAKYLASNTSARSNREQIMRLPLQLVSLASAFQAAQTLVDLATQEANESADERDEIEMEKLQEAYGKGANGRGIATGGVKAIKELEKEQKSRSARMVRDSIDVALLDIATFYRDVMMVQTGSEDSIINSYMREDIQIYASSHLEHSTILKIDFVMKARNKLAQNAAPLLTCEALMCSLAKQ